MISTLTGVWVLIAAWRSTQYSKIYFNASQVKSFIDDSIMGLGTVSMRVAFVLRSAEVQPTSLDLFGRVVFYIATVFLVFVHAFCVISSLSPSFGSGLMENGFVTWIAPTMDWRGRFVVVAGITLLKAPHPHGTKGNRFKRQFCGTPPALNYILKWYCRLTRFPPSGEKRGTWFLPFLSLWMFSSYILRTQC